MAEGLLAVMQWRPIGAIPNHPSEARSRSAPPSTIEQRKSATIRFLSVPTGCFDS